MRILEKTVLVILLIAILTIVGSAQTGGQPTLDDLQKRIVELESQLRTLSAEISKIKEANSAAAKKDSTVTSNLPASKMPAEPVADAVRL